MLFAGLSLGKYQEMHRQVQAFQAQKNLSEDLITAPSVPQIPRLFGLCEGSLAQGAQKICNSLSPRRACPDVP